MHWLIMVQCSWPLQAIPREAYAVRVWDPAARSYVPVDPYLDGAPRTEQEYTEMYVELIKKLKRSFGSETVNRLATRTSVQLCRDPMGVFDGPAVDNQWTRLAVATTI